MKSAEHVTTSVEQNLHEERFMTAAVLEEYGSAKNLNLQQIPRPEIGNQDVLIKVHAAGINPIDWRIRQGSLRFLLPAKDPIVLGFDVAGEIVKMGLSASRKEWNVGDEVMCFLDNQPGGGYAEYTVANADLLAPKPSNISFAEAAAVPLAAITALQSLRDIGKIRAGHHVLINGASGGVGTFAVQIAKAWGAEVTGVCSQNNFEFTSDLGADHVIDYQSEDFTQSNRRYDIVFDAVAKSSYSNCRRILQPKGCYIRTVPAFSTFFHQAITYFIGPRCRMVLARPNGEDLKLIGQMIESGKICPVIQQTFSFSEITAAHELSEAGHVQGKLVVVMDDTFDPTTSNSNKN